MRMDTEWNFAVFWDDGDDGEIDILSLEEVQAIATADFTEAEWLPGCIRRLEQVSA